RLRARAAAVLRVDDGGRDRLVYFVLPPCRVSQSVRRLGPPTRPGPEEAVAGPVEGGLRPRRPGAGPGARSRGVDPRRADIGPRPLHPPRLLAQHGRAGGVGPDDFHLVARDFGGGAGRESRWTAESG